MDTVGAYSQIFQFDYGGNTYSFRLNKTANSNTLQCFTIASGTNPPVPATPTVDIQNAPASITSLTPFTVTIKFSENVTGFAIGDITVGNGTASNFVAVDAQTYTVDITPNGNGDVTIDVPADVAQSGCLTNAAATEITVTYTTLQVSLSPSSIAFGNQALGTHSEKPVTLSNTGGASVTIDSIAIGGPSASELSESNDCPGSLGVGGQCTIDVTYAPTALGAASATLTVTSNAPSSPDTVALLGTGVALTKITDPSDPTFTAAVGGSGIGSGCGFTSDSFLAVQSLSPPPPSTNRYPLAALRFVLEHCSPGSTVTISLDTGQAMPGDARLLKLAGGAWSPYSATVSGKTIRYTITDNGTGDTDSTLGAIADPMVVAIPLPQPVPALSVWGIGIVSGLLGLIGGWARWRRRK